MEERTGVLRQAQDERSQEGIHAHLLTLLALQPAHPESARPVSADPESVHPESVHPESAHPESAHPELVEGLSFPSAEFLPKLDRRVRDGRH